MQIGSKGSTSRPRQTSSSKQSHHALSRKPMKLVVLPSLRLTPSWQPRETLVQMIRSMSAEHQHFNTARKGFTSARSIGTATHGLSPLTGRPIELVCYLFVLRCGACHELRLSTVIWPPVICNCLAERPAGLLGMPSRSNTVLPAASGEHPGASPLTPCLDVHCLPSTPASLLPEET